MIQEEMKFNNSVLACLVENKNYLNTKSLEGDEVASKLEQENTKLIEWYKRGNALSLQQGQLDNAEPEEKKAYRIPSNLKVRLRSHEVELVECMLECGFYYQNELNLSGVQRSLNVIFKTILANDLTDRMKEVNECVKRVQEMDSLGRVKDKQKYLVKSLQNLNN